MLPNDKLKQKVTTTNDGSTDSVFSIPATQDRRKVKRIELIDNRKCICGHSGQRHKNLERFMIFQKREKTASEISASACADCTCKKYTLPVTRLCKCGHAEKYHDSFTEQILMADGTYTSMTYKPCRYCKDKCINFKEKKHGILSQAEYCENAIKERIYNRMPKLSKPESLHEKQARFALMVADLILQANKLKYQITFGEAYRTKEQAEANARKGIGIKSSLHTLRLAIDLNLFKDGVFLTKTEDYLILGEYWESLSPDNRWGGRFGDGNHFSLEHEGVK